MLVARLVVSNVTLAVHSQLIMHSKPELGLMLPGELLLDISYAHDMANMYIDMLLIYAPTQLNSINVRMYPNMPTQTLPFASSPIDGSISCLLPMS